MLNPSVWVNLILMERVFFNTPWPKFMDICCKKKASSTTKNVKNSSADDIDENLPEGWDKVDNSLGEELEKTIGSNGKY